MILRVGPFLYPVRFVQGYIEHEGQNCLGLCDNDAHEILISDVPALPQQVQVICHEYMEAWLFHFGANLQDKEDYCDLFGMAMAQFVLDLTHQIHAFAQQDPSAPLPAAPASDPALSAASIGADWPHHPRWSPAVPTPVLSPLPNPPPPPDRSPEPRPPAAGAAAPQADPRPHSPRPPAIATKLAAQAARLGLRVSRVYNPPCPGDVQGLKTHPRGTEKKSETADARR